MKEHGVPDWYAESCVVTQIPILEPMLLCNDGTRMAWFKASLFKCFYQKYG